MTTSRYKYILIIYTTLLTLFIIKWGECNKFYSLCSTNLNYYLYKHITHTDSMWHSFSIHISFIAVSLKSFLVRSIWIKPYTQDSYAEWVILQGLSKISFIPHILSHSPVQPTHQLLYFLYATFQSFNAHMVLNI